ncbi:SRPBCC domain-containing protein [Lysinibacillus sp. SGAir0095]|uniref:SRPBCC domain-containing protein n=1 Tax=Lysinibacillus sp. SGAir0095 TaxID=2070463 RepID=UPI0010CD3DAD|nr:SRPBCC domain-containing protein [Lysinibacillus sp. SGAir0095]QCR32769.1 activator of Hsp90 ATPase 1 family protein [Lysinibacillus sp. SGAir0095]
MLAKIYKSEAGYIAEYDRYFDVPTEKVWPLLISNEKFKLWMEHLEITDLRKGGNINFHYNDGSGNLEKIKITDYVDDKALQFEWGEDTVRFEIIPENSGTLLVMKQFLTNLTDHTPKDLAGWHVCLLRFNDVVTGESTFLPEDEWEKWYVEYKLLVHNLDNQ